MGIHVQLYMLLPALPSVCLLISCKLWVLCTRSRSTLTKVKKSVKKNCRLVIFTCPPAFCTKMKKRPTSQPELLFQEILPLVGSLTFFHFGTVDEGGGCEQLKSNLYKTPGLIRGCEVWPILCLKLNNFLSSSSRQQYREGSVGDHECYMPDIVELYDWQKEILILKNESFSPLEV